MIDRTDWAGRWRRHMVWSAIGAAFALMLFALNVWLRRPWYAVVNAVTLVTFAVLFGRAATFWNLWRKEQP
jgi:cell division protein FtsW (lipid II flippase)